jgi:hypothetical protein
MILSIIIEVPEIDYPFRPKETEHITLCKKEQAAGKETACGADGLYISNQCSVNSIQ